MFEFAWPWIFILLPLPWFIKRFVSEAKMKDTVAVKVPFFASIQQISQVPLKFRSRLRTNKYVTLFIWCLIIIAAAGPQIVGDPIHLPQSGRNIMLAMDISGSMQIPDMATNDKKTDRLDVVKQVAGNFIRGRVGDRLGLILFGTRAYLQTPLTFDRKTVLTMLEDASIGLAGPETAIGDAIGLATKRLMKYPKQSSVIILLTDGANNTGTLTPLQGATLAGKEGIRIYTIGIGADKLVVSGLLGPQMINPSSDLDEQTLGKIAKTTGGLYFRAKNSKSLQQIYNKLDELEPIDSNATLFRPTFALYPWPLALAFLLSLVLINRKITWRQRRYVI